MPTVTPLQSLFESLPQTGRVDWRGMRRGRVEPMVEVPQAHISPGAGLEGDRYQGRTTGRRQVTLIQHEHLPVIAACVHRGVVEPALLRRNIVVSGINLLALKDKTFRIGQALLEYTGPCEPCSKMERFLGPGGFNAMRGHGGITARVLESGDVAVGNTVRYGP